MPLNQDLFDASLRHAIGLRRLSAGEVRQAIKLLEKSDAELVAKLRKRLARPGARDFTSRRYQELLKSVREMRTDTMLTARKAVTRDVKRIARIEQEFERRILTSTIPVRLELATVQPATLNALVTSKPFSGGTNAARTLSQWFGGLQRSDATRLTEAISLGVTQGETIDQIVRRVAGTRSKGYTDGALAISRREATAVVRTAVNHASNVAREELWKANSDIIAGVQWVSTLEGNTCLLCGSRDGNAAAPDGGKLPKGAIPLDPSGARPPAHPNCRCLMIALLDQEGIADRAGVRPEKSDINVGPISAKTRYDDWLGGQSAKFQDSVLGKKKGALFRRGGLELSHFVDRQGTEVTLSDLARTNPDAFKKAGMNPDLF